MEILNENQRNRAKWRLVLIGIAVVVLLALSMCSSHNQYADKKPLRDCEKEKLDLQYSMDGQLTQFRIDTSSLHETIRQLKAEALAPDDNLQRLNDKIQDLKDDIKDLKDDKAEIKAELESCRTRVAILSSNN